MERYSIGVTGQIQTGFDRSDVQQRLTTLFKCSPEKALGLISGNPVMLKTGLDRQTVERFRQQLLEAGVAPAIKKHPARAKSQTASPSTHTTLSSGNGSNAAASSPSAAGSVPRQTAATTPKAGSGTRPCSGPSMDCPKCGARQPRAEICVGCGIVIAKFRGTEISEIRNQQFTFEPASELEELGTFVGDNFSAYHHKFQKLIDNQGSYHFHWHWPAFFIPFPWLLYRKLYLHAIILMSLALLPVPFLGLALPILSGALGNYLYFRHCRGKLAAVDAMGADRYRAIAFAGGTLSIPTTILVSILLSALVSYAGYRLYFKDQIHPFGPDDQLAVISQVDGEAGKNSLGKMVTLGQFLRIYTAAEKMAGKQSAQLESMGDIRRTFQLDAKAVSDEWGTELEFFQDGGKILLRSAGQDREFSTPDDLSYEIQL